MNESNIKCLNHNETLDYVIESKCGTSRFGDGGLLGLLNDVAIKSALPFEAE